MEAVIFDGKEYVKASVVAERFKYTQDYIGQLCRGKKVDARLVGRAWYINLESLDNHKKARYKGPETTQSKTDNLHAPEKFLSRIDVEPVLKKKTVKILKNTGNKLTQFPVIYENDDFSLIPHVNRNSITKTLAILPAEAEELSVAATKESVKVTNFTAEPLPEVYLKGILRVDGLPEALEEQISESTKDKSQLVTDSLGIPEEKHPVVKNTSDKIIPVESKKPIKIKLYRGESKISSRFATSKNNLDFKRSQLGNVANMPLSRPVKKLAPLEKVSMDRKTLLENRTIASQVVKKEAVIPHATFKAILIFGILSAVAIGLLLPKESLLVSAGSVDTKWNISFEQAQGIKSLLHTK